MSEHMVDVTLHIDETTSHEQRESFCDSLRALDGVLSAATHDEKPHLLVVGYDPDRIKSSEFLNVAKESGLHAELIGL